MNTFKQFYIENTNDDLFHLRTQWKQMGADVFIYLNGNDLQLHSIKVDINKRGTGVGTKVMREILDFARENGYRVTLSPSTDLGATSMSRLEAFYKRFGFVHNRGRNKDFSVSDTMIWEPNTK
jgi:GNAT superfamily N-acetyltransferase